MDVGAGCGRITAQLAPLCDEVIATEVSPMMIDRLKARGFTTLLTCDLDKDLATGEQFDMVCLLNVIDRCDQPVTLLRQVRNRIKDGGLLLLADPMPLRPSVETNSGWQKPSENIVDPNHCACCYAPKCCVWEESVRQIVREYFEPNGFVLRSVSRVPYISQGDSIRPYYVLDDAVFVLTKVPDGGLVKGMAGSSGSSSGSRSQSTV